MCFLEGFEKTAAEHDFDPKAHRRKVLGVVAAGLGAGAASAGFGLHHVIRHNQAIQEAAKGVIAARMLGMNSHEFGKHKAEAQRLMRSALRSKSRAKWTGAGHFLAIGGMAALGRHAHEQMELKRKKLKRKKLKENQ